MTEKIDSSDSNQCADSLNAEQWKSDNQDAIASYNADVEKNGVFGDSWRGQISCMN